MGGDNQDAARRGGSNAERRSSYRLLLDPGAVQYSLDKRALDNVVIAAVEGSGLTILDGASDTSEDGFTWSLALGYQILPYLAVEAGYVDLGTAEY